VTLARRYAALGIVGLFALQFCWHGFLLPPVRMPGWTVAALFSLPILPALVLVLLRHPRAGFWGALAALAYFCHGVAEAWADSDARPLALLEAALSVWLVLAASWDGMKARFGRHRRPGGPV